MLVGKIGAVRKRHAHRKYVLNQCCCQLRGLPLTAVVVSEQACCMSAGSGCQAHLQGSHRCCRGDRSLQAEVVNGTQMLSALPVCSPVCLQPTAPCLRYVVCKTVYAWRAPHKSYHPIPAKCGLPGASWSMRSKRLSAAVCKLPCLNGASCHRQP